MDTPYVRITVSTAGELLTFIELRRDRLLKSTTRRYAKQFPCAEGISVSACDRWGRSWPTTGPALCPKCGQWDASGGCDCTKKPAPWGFSKDTLDARGF